MKYITYLLITLSFTCLNMGVAQIIDFMYIVGDEQKTYKIEINAKGISFPDQTLLSFLKKTYPPINKHLKLEEPEETTKKDSNPQDYIPANVISQILFEITPMINFVHDVIVSFSSGTDVIVYLFKYILQIRTAKEYSQYDLNKLIQDVKKSNYKVKTIYYFKGLTENNIPHLFEYNNKAIVYYMPEFEQASEVKDSLALGENNEIEEHTFEFNPKVIPYETIRESSMSTSEREGWLEAEIHIKSIILNNLSR
jgi:hypothetical protein